MKFRQNIQSRLAAILIAAFAVTGMVALPAQADDAPDYDVICCSYHVTGVQTTSNGVVYGSDVLQKQYSYLSMDANGNLHEYRLTIKDHYSWKRIVADGSMFIKIDWAYGSLMRYSINESSVYPGIVAHNSNGQARLFPFLSSAANNVFQWPLDWSGPATSYHQHVWLSFPWQFADTRWIRDTGHWTIQLPLGEKFWNCNSPNSTGKTIYTFTTTTSYQR